MYGWTSFCSCMCTRTTFEFLYRTHTVYRRTHFNGLFLAPAVIINHFQLSSWNTHVQIPMYLFDLTHLRLANNYSFTIDSYVRMAAPSLCGCVCTMTQRTSKFLDTVYRVPRTHTVCGVPGKLMFNPNI